MALRYITGRSGQGKTEYLVKEVIRRSIEIPEKQYYVIVPEQFSLEMQRKIVKMHPRHGFFNIDVLSFHRLSYRIFAECNYQPKEILEDLGVSMMLRKILSEEEGDFLYFKKSMKKPGFIDELKSMLMEFIGYGVSWKQVEEVTKQLDENKSLCNKCEELGRIYERFEKAIEGRFMVTEQILDIAREFTGNAPMLKNAVFYFDGFAGFTPVQISFLRELLKVAAQINVTVTIPEFIPGQKGMSEDLFNASKKTADALLMLCKENMQEVEEVVKLDTPVSPRFINNPELAFLEKNLFQNSRKICSKKMERIHMTVCRNPDGEADYVMHKIEQLVRQKGYRYRDFAVLSGDVAEYASAFKRKAAILNIPVFEDTKKKVSYHSGVEAVRSLFHLAQMDYSYESVFRYLKSGMSDLMDEEADYLENYVLYAGIRGLSMWKKPFVRRLKNKEEDMIKELHTLQERFMKEAIRQAKKAEALEEVPIGCVIVHEGKIIARGYNRRNTDKNTLSHAELNAIRKASKKLGDWRLEGCTMYVTLEPCQMCSGALVQSRIDEVVIGCMNAKAGCAGSVMNLLQVDGFNHQVKITQGVLEEECSSMLSEFFRKLREKKKQEKAALKAAQENPEGEPE